MSKYRTECPKCKSESLDRGFMHPHGGNQLERSVLCLDCGHSWLEIYDIVLIRIEDSEPKEDVSVKADPCEDCPMQSYKHCGQCSVTKEETNEPGTVQNT